VNHGFLLGKSQTLFQDVTRARETVQLIKNPGGFMFCMFFFGMMIPIDPNMDDDAVKPPTSIVTPKR